jgi:general nucleoside transport system permease protein
VIAELVTLTFAIRVVQIAVSYALAAIGGAVTERAGIIDLALEAKLIFGAYAAAAFAHGFHSAEIGVVGGIFAGMTVAAVQTFFALRLRADQVIIGIALNLLAITGTRFLLQLMYGQGANSPECPSFGDALVTNPILWLAVAAAIVVPVAMARMRWGLRLRAAGDRPDALVAVGASPGWARLYAALVGGGLAGAGGAQLSLSNGGFVADAWTARGYTALAMVILAGWRPAWAAIACVGMAIAVGISDELQLAGTWIPRELAQHMPYILVIVVLAIFGGRQPPRALGKL